MSSSRTSIRLKKKKSGVPSLDLAGPIPAETIDDIVATSGNSVEEFIGTFHGLGTKHLESFFKNLNKSQTLECWKNWSKLYTDQDPAIFSIFLNLIKSSLQDEKVVPPLHSIIKTINPLLSSDKYSDTIRNNILSICDRQFKDFISDQVFVSHLIIYLLRKNLDDNFSASTAKRIINVLTETRIMETLEPTLKPWILRTINEKSYYLNKEGIKCLAFIVVKSKYNYGNQFHEMTKSILPGMKIENIYAIGELYKKIWLKYTSSQRENFQQNCIQELMYHGVLANRNLPKDYEIFPQILRLLDPLHQDKNNKNIQAMLYNLWEPILWRNLKAPNHNVRCNAAEFLFSAFPCENPFLNLEERTLVHDNQIKVMNDLLLDQEPSVRLIGVKGVCQVLSTYWAFLSSDSINELMMTLIKKSSRDSDSVQIRVAVLNGLSDIIKDAPSSHVYLKNIIPKVGDSLRDVNEHVRLSMLDLLSIVKSVKYIAYWEICSLDDLLYCLSRDNSPAVCRRLVKLIFNSFFPMKEPESVKLERCVFLIEKNVSAANKFYKYSNKYMELVDSVKFMLTILVSFKRHLSVAPNFNSHQNSIEDDSFSNKENVDEEQPSNLVNSEQDISNTFSRVEADSFLSDFIIMDNFLDIITVMWISRYEDLLKEENTEYRAVLEKKTTKIMTNMFRVYKGTDMSRKIIYLCSLFSQKSVNTIVKYCLSSLKTCDFQALIEGGTKLDTKSAISSWKGNFSSKEPQNFSIFIDALCNWKKGQDLMELILYGIEKGFENINGLSLSLASSAKRRKSVRFIEKDDKIQLRSISFLTYVFRHSINKQRVTSENMKELKEIYIELSKIKDFVKRGIEQNHFNEDAATEQYVLYTWETYLKTMLMVEDDNSVISSFVFEWLNYLRLSTSSSNLRSYVLCTFLLFLSNAFSLGKLNNSNEEVLTETVIFINHFNSPNAVEEDDSMEVSYLCLALLGEIQEWIFHQKSLTDINATLKSIQGCLVGILKNLKLGSDENHTITSNIKQSLNSFVDSCKLYTSKPDSFFNLMKVFSQMIIEDMNAYLKKFEEEPLPNFSKELPPLSLFLIQLLVPKYGKHLIEELRISLQLKSLSEKDILSAIWFIYILVIDVEFKISTTSLQNCFVQLKQLQVKDSRGLELMKSIQSHLDSQVD